MNDEVSRARFRFREERNYFESLTGTRVIVVSFDLTDFCSCF